MKSSFKKIEPAGSSNSSSRALFGHPTLDAVLGNRFQKGTMLVMEQDHPTSYYLSFLRCFVSTQINQNLACLVLDDDAFKWHQLIAPITKEPSKVVKKKPQEAAEIAWRYNSMQMGSEKLSIDPKSIHLDLSKQVKQFDNKLLLTRNYSNTNDLWGLYGQVEESLMEMLQSEVDTQLKKVLIQTLPSRYYSHPQFGGWLRAIRCLARSSHVLVLISVPPIIPQQVRRKLLIHTDVYLKVLECPQLFKDFNALIKVVKEADLGGFRSKQPAVNTWGIKQNKKQLVVQSLYEHVEQGDPAENQAKKGPETF